MAGPTQKTLEATSQAKVEFTTDFVMANPRNGVYAVNAGSGFLRITLPKEKNDELLALRRANASSAQAWMDSTAESVRRQYEKTSSTNFSFTLLPVGEVKAAKAEADTTGRVPIKIIQAPVQDTTKFQRRGETAPAPEVAMATSTGKVPAPAVSTGKMEVDLTTEPLKSVSGKGTEKKPYVIDVTTINIDKDPKGQVTLSVPLPFSLDTDNQSLNINCRLLITAGQLKAIYEKGADAAIMKELSNVVRTALERYGAENGVNPKDATYPKEIEGASGYNMRRALKRFVNMVTDPALVTQMSSDPKMQKELVALSPKLKEYFGR